MAKSIAETQAIARKGKVVVASVERFGEKLIVPDGMRLQDAMQVIQRAMDAEETIVALVEDFDCFPQEGAYALKLALEELYGWVDIQPTPSFFGDVPPMLIGVTVNERGDTVQVPWGMFLCPAIPKADGHLESGAKLNNDKMYQFYLAGELKQKYAPEFKKLCACVRKHLVEHSLYRAKALSLVFTGADGKPLKMPEPKFIKLDKVDLSQLVFPADVEAAVKTNLFAPVLHTEAVRKAGIPLKRGVLLAGDYGVGKTLVAFVTAKLAIENGWTFIYCRNISEFQQMVRFAAHYQPSIVFCEDIDKVLDGNRDVTMDHILNVLDGVDSKRNDIMVILTTNDVAKIHPAALRPGRLDAVIHVARPDADAAERLVRLYAGDQLAASEDLSTVREVLAGQIPAVIRECVERSKLYAISHGVTDRLTAVAILESAKTMEMQLNLLAGKREEPENAMLTFGNALGKHIACAAIRVVDAWEQTQPEKLAAARLALNSGSGSNGNRS